MVLKHFLSNETEVFEQFKSYMLAWGLGFIEVSPQSTGKSGTFTFATQGKIPLLPESRLDGLRQQTQKSQLEVGKTPELISKHLISQQGNELRITKRANYKQQMWLGFWLSFVLGGLMEAGMVYLLACQPPKEIAGVYIMLVIVGLLWLLFSYMFYDSAKTDFCIISSPEQILFRQKKGKEKYFDQEKIDHLLLKEVISRGRFTTVNTTLYVVLKSDPEAPVLVGGKYTRNNGFILITMESGRPEKTDSQLVRDAAYDSGMRIARLVAKPMALKIRWEKFNE